MKTTARFSGSLLWIGLVAPLLLSACGTVAPIAVNAPRGFDGHSEAWAAGQRQAGSGLFTDESFDLGPYRVVEVRRDLASSQSSLSLGPLSWGKTADGFSFQLQGPQERVQGRCERREGETRLPVWGNQIPLQASFGLKCDCQGPQTHAQLELASASSWQIEDAWLPERVQLRVNGQSLTGRPFDLMGDTSEDGRAFVGFRFDSAGGPAAAVGLFSPGQVWLHDNLPASQRAAVSCALAGLLLHAGS
ncbi:hypothetical protein [Roseateles albus]|uniref:Lipoprotein n=1 Tax=Roseateles albus TaxID=2987525 RepID=A0ABT5KF38_9BURK|nr:hypothetical protein [Roseateles albus]MDC8772535.1 hypothetical protein [Roseateles albus]